MNGHIDTGYGVVFAGNRFKIGGVEFGIFNPKGFGTGGCLGGHGVGDVTCRYFGSCSMCVYEKNCIVMKVDKRKKEMKE